MKKKIVFLMTIAFIVAFSSIYVSAQEVYEPIGVDVNTINIVVDGQRVIADNFLYNDTTYVPIRCISEMFGKDVKYVESENAAFISDTDTPTEVNQPTALPVEKSGQSIEVVRNSIKIYVNGSLVESDNFVYNDTTYVPLRKVSDMLGKAVNWDQLTNTAAIGQKPQSILDGESLGDINGRPYTKALVEFYKSQYAGQELPDGMSVDEAVMKQIKIDFAMLDYALQKGIAAGVTFENNFQSAIASFEVQYGEEGFDNLLKENGFDRMSYRYGETINYIYNQIISEPEFASTSDEIVKFYNDNLDTYFLFDGRRAKHVLIMPKQDEDGNISDSAWKEALTTAKTVYDEAKKGTSFDELIAQYNQDPGAEKYPDGYTFGKGQMVPEFENACYSMNVGDISEPVKTEYGYHVIELEEIVKYAPLDQVSNSISEYLTNIKFSQFFENKIMETPAE